MSVYYTETIEVNMIPGKALPVCHVSQGDDGREIKVDLIDGIFKHTIESGETAEVRIKKQDGSVYKSNVSVTPGATYVTLTVTSDMDDIAGNNLCEIRLTKAGVVKGTGNFIMRVEEDPYSDGSSPEPPPQQLAGLTATNINIMSAEYTSSELPVT